MKKLLMILLVVSNVQAIEFLKPNGAVVAGALTVTQLETLWKSPTATCIKDGSKFMGANTSFIKGGLTTRDCSNGSNAKAKHSALGISVKVLKIKDLPSAVIKQMYKRGV